MKIQYSGGTGTSSCLVHKMMNYQIEKKTKTIKQTNRLISDLLQSYFFFNYYFWLNLACFVLPFLGRGGGVGEGRSGWVWWKGDQLALLYSVFICSSFTSFWVIPYKSAFLWTLYCIIYYCVSLQSPSTHLLFIIRKASPEGYLFQASGVTRGRKITSWRMWKERKIFQYFEGTFIKMLRRNTPYGNIIYTLIQLKVTRKWPEDLFSYRFILTKRIYEKGTTFKWIGGRCTKGVPFVKNSIYKGKGLNLGAKPPRTKLY